MDPPGLTESRFPPLSANRRESHMTSCLREFPDDFNMADYFVFSNIDAGRGEKTAIYFEGHEISYGEVAENVMRTARNLVADGLLPEQRVLVCMQDRPEFAYAWFGAL